MYSVVYCNIPQIYIIKWSKYSEAKMREYKMCLIQQVIDKIAPHGKASIEEASDLNSKSMVKT